jgi:hypothetical protein
MDSAPTSLENADPEGIRKDVVLVVGQPLRLAVLLRLRPSARLVVFRELRKALDYLRQNRVSQILIDPTAFGAGSEVTQ